MYVCCSGCGQKRSDGSSTHGIADMRELDVIKRVATAVNPPGNQDNGAVLLAVSIVKSIREPDPHAVAAVADQLKMDATKVAAVWMLLIDETLKG